MKVWTIGLGVWLTAAAVSAQSTIDPGRRFAYSADAGFVDFKPDEPPPSGGAVVGERVLSGFVFAANIGWIDLGDGSPADGVDYRNDSAGDYGVNVLPGGALSGFAFSANVGWINFEQIHGRPAIDLITGEFRGFAWSGNVGWINLGGGGLATLSIDTTDSDGDGIGDAYEVEYFNNLTTADASTDFDRDGVSDRDEFAASSDPTDPADFFRIIEIAPSPSLSALYRITFTSEPGRVYSLESTSAFDQWTTVPGFEGFPPDAGTVTHVDVPAFGQTPPRFWRIRVRTPL